MVNRKNYARPLQDVWKNINMQKGDKLKCWDWQGTVYTHMGKGNGNPIFFWNGRRLQARRVAYALFQGIPYADVPLLRVRCNNDKCCNPHHIEPVKTSIKIPDLKEVRLI